MLVASHLPHDQRDAELCSLFNIVLQNLQRAQELEHINSSLVCLKSFLHKLKVATDCTSQGIPADLPASLTAACPVLERYCTVLAHDESSIGLLCDAFIQIASIVNSATLSASISQLMQRMFYDRRYVKCFETVGALGVAGFSDDVSLMVRFMETALSAMSSPMLVEGHPDLAEALWTSLRRVCNYYLLSVSSAYNCRLSKLRLQHFYPSILSCCRDFSPLSTFGHSRFRRS
jgi:hypothetical protein